MFFKLSILGIVRPGILCPRLVARKLSSISIENYMEKAESFAITDPKMITKLALSFMRTDDDNEKHKQLALAEADKKSALAEADKKSALSLAEKDRQSALDKAQAHTTNAQRESYLKSLLGAVTQR